MEKRAQKKGQSNLLFLQAGSSMLPLNRYILFSFLEQGLSLPSSTKFNCAINDGTATIAQQLAYFHFFLKFTFCALLTHPHALLRALLSSYWPNNSITECMSLVSLLLLLLLFCFSFTWIWVSVCVLSGRFLSKVAILTTMLRTTEPWLSPALLWACVFVSFLPVGQWRLIRGEQLCVCVCICVALLISGLICASLHVTASAATSQLSVHCFRFKLIMSSLLFALIVTFLL